MLCCFQEKLMECSIARSSEFNLGYLTSLAVQSLAQHVSSMSLSPDNIFEVHRLKNWHDLL